MSRKLKILAALNIVGWAVVVPLLVSSLLNPLLDFREWPGSDVPGGPTQDASLPDLAPAAKRPSAGPPGAPGTRLGPVAPGVPGVPGVPAISGLAIARPNPVPGLRGPSQGTGVSGRPLFAPTRTGSAGLTRPELPAGPATGFPPVPVRPGGGAPGAPGPLVVPNLGTPQPEIPSGSAPGNAGPISESAPESGPLDAPVLTDRAPSAQPEVPVSAISPGAPAGNAEPDSTPTPTPAPTTSAGQGSGSAAPSAGTVPPAGPQPPPEDKPSAKHPTADRGPEHPGPPSDDGDGDDGPGPPPDQSPPQSASDAATPAPETATPVPVPAPVTPAPNTGAPR